jgi:hypothetical protein
MDRFSKIDRWVNFFSRPDMFKPRVSVGITFRLFSSCPYPFKCFILVSWPADCTLNEKTGKRNVLSRFVSRAAITTRSVPPWRCSTPFACYASCSWWVSQKVLLKKCLLFWLLVSFLLWSLPPSALASINSDSQYRDSFSAGEQRGLAQLLLLLLPILLLMLLVIIFMCCSIFSLLLPLCNCLVVNLLRLLLPLSNFCCATQPPSTPPHGE